MEIVKGKITKVSDFGGRYSYQLDDGQYYSAFGTPEFKEGDRIEIEYRLNVVGDKEYKNILGVRKSKEGETIKEDYGKGSVDKEELANIHEWAYKTAKEIIGRDLVNGEFHFVNSLVVSYLKEKESRAR